MSKPGRKPLLDEAKLREACAMASLGCRLHIIARYLGCSRRTLIREFDRNPEFRERVTKAQAGAQMAPLDAVRRAAATHWRAGAWLLERIYPMDFAPRPSDAVPLDIIHNIVSGLIGSLAKAFPDPVVRTRIRKALRGDFDAQVKRIQSPHRPASKRYDPSAGLKGVDEYRDEAIRSCHQAETEERAAAASAVDRATASTAQRDGGDDQPSCEQSQAAPNVDASNQDRGAEAADCPTPERPASDPPAEGDAT